MRHAKFLLLSLVLLMGALVAPASPGSAAGGPTLAAGSSYAIDFISTAAFGADMNDAGDVAGTSYRDTGCGSNCLPPQDTVVWRGGQRIILPTVAGLSGITVKKISNQGWVVGSAGVPGTFTHAVVWKPNGTTYTAIDLGVMPGTDRSEAVGIDNSNRVVGWSIKPYVIAKSFLWTETGGFVDLGAAGYPNEAPLAISPSGVVGTFNYWYRLGDPTSVRTLAPPPRGYYIGGTGAVNDRGDQAQFLVSTSTQNLLYLFRYHHDGVWQLLSGLGTGHLSSAGVGSINLAQDVTATVLGSAVIAFGPNGLAQGLGSLVSPAYGAVPTAAGPMNASSQILSSAIIGRSRRVIRLTPAVPCTYRCIRVSAINMKATGPGYCNTGQLNHLVVKLSITTETGAPLQGVTVTGHILDDYWTDKVVSGISDPKGVITFTYQGPPCVGALAFLVSDAFKNTGRTFDRTTGVLANYVIPTVGS